MHLLEMSRAWKEMYQIADDKIGKSHYQTFQQQPAHWIAAHQAALNGNASEYIEEPYKLLNGAAGWHRWQCLPWHELDGAIKGIIISAEDTTSKKNREIELNALLARFELIQQAAKIGMWDWDIVRGNIIFNAEYYEILGCDKYRNLSIEEFYDLIHPDDHDRVRAALNSALNIDAAYEAEFRIYRRNDRKLRWVKDKGTIEFNENGAPVRGYGAIIDITQQKALTNEQLRMAGRDFDAFINAMLEGIWCVDRNGITTYVNAAVTEMIGYSEDELIGASMFSYSDDEWRAIAFKKFNDRTHGKSERHKFLIRRKDGYRFWALISANPQFENGEFIGTVAVISDFTKHMEELNIKDKRIDELEKLLSLDK